MPTPGSTAMRILEASRTLFNERGYAGTTVADIADAAGIAPGNLTYHFPTKHDLVVAMRAAATERMEARRQTRFSDDLIEQYVQRLVDVYEVAGDYRFLLRDRAQFDDAELLAPPPLSMVADYSDLRSLLDRLRAEGLMRNDLDVDLDLLCRTLWILGRHWPDHIREMEQRSQLTATDRRRGMEHHFSILLPTLTADARRRFRSSLDAVAPELDD